MSKTIAANISNWVDGYPCLLTHINIFPSMACNLRCRVCERQVIGNYNNNVLSAKAMALIEKDITEIPSIKEILVGGNNGEPMINKDAVVNFLCNLSKRGIVTALQTNGTLLDSKTIEKIVVNRVNLISISLDGHIAKIHDYLRGYSGIFDKVIANIKYINNMKKSLNSELPKVCLLFLITNINYKYIPDFLRLSKVLAVEEVIFMPLGGRCDRFKLNKDQIDELELIFNGLTEDEIKVCNAKSLLDRGRYNNIQDVNNACNSEVDYSSETLEIIKDFNSVNYIDIDRLDAKREKINLYDRFRNAANNNILNAPCYNPWFKIFIKETGEVDFCHYFRTSVGYLKNNTLQQIWNNEIFEKIRNEFLKGAIPMYCSNCCGPQQFETESIKKVLYSYRENKGITINPSKSMV